jgi:hypothetical protein
VDSTPAPKKEAGGESGIALFMVVSAMAILSILAVDMTYVAGVNQRMSYDGLDQVRAHYLAKTGLKLSLLRLKAYQQVQALVGKATDGQESKGGVPGVPKLLLERIWSFPFFFPIPTTIPGLTPSERDRIAAFQKESSLDGRFSAAIESESSRYNLNLVLAPFAPEAKPSPGPSASPSPAPQASPSPGPQFNPEDARNSLQEFLMQILDNKFKADPDFAAEYRDLRVEDLMDNLLAWADRTYEKKGSSGREDIKPKRAPFYSLSELHMIPPMDDQLYELFAPNLTVSTTPGINVNSMKRPTLRALIPQMTDEELDDFFKFRDSETEDNYFKSEDDFFKYVQDKVAAFRQDPEEIRRLREALAKRGIRLVTDETTFKITVRAEVNQAARLLEAWVTLLSQKDQGQPKDAPPPAGSPPPLSGPGPRTDEPPKSGLKVTFMRII